MRTAFIKALCEIAEREERVWLINGDLGYGVVEAFSERFPGRCVNAGVAEQNMTGIAAGLALSGKIVFTYSIANFPTLRCLEQIRNDICYHGGAVTIVAVGGGFAYGSLGYSHHGVEDLAIMSVLPNMRVIAPGDPVETALAVERIVADPGPTYLRLSKAGDPVVHRSTPDFQIGRAIEVRAGRDLTAISTGAMLCAATEAADRLRAEGISMRVLSMHTVKPLDTNAVRKAALETGAILTVEEHRLDGGLGSRVADALIAAQVLVPMRKIGLSEKADYAGGSAAWMRARMGSIDETARALVAEKRGRHAASGAT